MNTQTPTYSNFINLLTQSGITIDHDELHEVVETPTSFLFIIDELSDGGYNVKSLSKETNTVDPQPLFYSLFLFQAKQYLQKHMDQQQ